MIFGQKIQITIIIKFSLDFVSKNDACSIPGFFLSRIYEKNKPLDFSFLTLGFSILWLIGVIGTLLISE